MIENAHVPRIERRALKVGWYATVPFKATVAKIIEVIAALISAVHD